MSHKTTKILFRITTILVFITTFPSAFMISNPATKEAMMHLGVGADRFIWTLEIGKTLGALILILPQIKGRLKEWTYAAFGIDFIAAFIAILSVDGFGKAWFVLVFIAVLLVSYTTYTKLNPHKTPLY